jgi:hypothetical protein
MVKPVNHINCTVRKKSQRQRARVQKRPELKVAGFTAMFLGKIRLG